MVGKGRAWARAFRFFEISLFLERSKRDYEGHKLEIVLEKVVAEDQDRIGAANKCPQIDGFRALSAGVDRA